MAVAVPAPMYATSPPYSPWTMSPNPLAEETCTLNSSYTCVGSMLRHDGHIYSVAIDGEFLYTGSDSRRIRVWKQPELVERGCCKSRSGAVRALLAVGDTVFSAHADFKIRIWRNKIGSNVKLASLPTFKNSLYSYFHSDKLKRWRIRHTDVISSLAYNTKEGLLYSGSWDRSVKVWRLSDLKCVDSIAAHEGAVNAVVVSNDGALLFTASAEGAIKVWRKVPGEYTHTLTMTLRFQRSPVNALALSDDETLLYSGSSDGSVSYWEKDKNDAFSPCNSSGRLHHGGFLRGHAMSVLCLASMDNLVFSGSEDSTIRIWRREIGVHVHSCLAVLRGHRGAVTCIAASVDRDSNLGLGGDYLVCSGSLDSKVKVWVVSASAQDEESEQNEAETPVKNRQYEAGEEEQDESYAGAANYGVVPVLSPSWVQVKLDSVKSPSRI